MGVVYRAEDLRLGKMVAPKFLSPALAAVPLAIERLQREARGPRVVGGQDQCQDRERRRAANPDRPLGAAPAEGAMERPGGGGRLSRLAGPLAEGEGRGRDWLRRRERRHPLARRGLVNPLHELVLVSLGMPLLDNLNLDPLAREARQRGRWTFLFVASPLRVPVGTGSPLNPLAIF